MTSIVYTCVNEGMRKLIEYPPRSGSLVEVADTLQTVLHTVPIGEARQQEVADTEYTYFYNSNGRHLVGVACRRPAGQQELPPTEVRQVRSFMADAMKLAPADKSVSLGPEALNAWQQVLKRRLEATTDAKINDVNATIAAARRTMETNIEQTLARGDDVSRLQDRSAQLADSAKVMETRAGEVNDTMCWNKYKMYICLVVVFLIVISVIVTWLCGPTLAGCRSASPQQGGTTTTIAPLTTTPPPVIIAH